MGEYGEYNGKKISRRKKKNCRVLFSNENLNLRKLEKLFKESAEFKFNYKDDDKIVGTHTISNLSKKNTLVKMV